ncbi:hypothetical protein [Collinsella tanakaei]|uniref:hypothetical protein n=1 Tax=Collinsella tanakaei TaxID=626935 RepID=UPI0039F52B49
MLAIYHVHTEFSDDSVYPLDAVCRDAISFRYGLPDLQPCTQTLKLYRELGGRVITFGSDSRKPEHLGAHIPEVRERLRNLGFTEFCTYRHMQPVFHAL